MLLIFGLAVVGVLVEAFAPRHLRRPLQLALTLGGLVAAFALTIVVASSNTLFAGGSPGNAAAVGTVGVDQPTLFIQGTILVLAFISVLLIAEQAARHQPVRRARPRPCRAAPRNVRAWPPARCTPRCTRWSCSRWAA